MIFLDLIDAPFSQTTELRNGRLSIYITAVGEIVTMRTINRNRNRNLKLKIGKRIENKNLEIYKRSSSSERCMDT